MGLRNQGLCCLCLAKPLLQFHLTHRSPNLIPFLHPIADLSHRGKNSKIPDSVSPGDIAPS